MIHLFNCTKEIINLPCTACSGLAKLCGNISCKPCEDLCSRPLGSYVLLAICLGGGEAFLTIHTLLHKERLAACRFPPDHYGSEIGVENWLYVQSGLAWLNLVFAPYVQGQVVRKLYQDADGGLAGRVPAAAGVREAAAEVIKYDIGVLLYVLTLCFSLAWSFLGWRWIQSNEFTCSPDGYPIYAALLGVVSFWAIMLYSAVWWCCTGAAASLSHDPSAAHGHRRAPLPQQHHQQYQRVAHPGRYQNVPQSPNFHGQPAHASAYQHACPPPGSRDYAAYACSQAERGDPLKPHLDVEDAREPASGPQGFRGSPYASGCARMCRPGQLLKLCACMSLDMCGNASYMLPEVGEGTDLAFAPAQAVALKVLFNSKFVAFAGLAEELMPGTDLVPTATIAWFLETFAPEHWLTVSLGIEATPDYPPPQWSLGPTH